MSDALPPSASVAYYDAAGMKKWSDGYSLLLGALKSETSSDLDAILGDKYPKWIRYRDSYAWPAPPAQVTQEEVFTNWANMALSPILASKAISVYEQGLNAPLARALKAFRDPANKQQFVGSDDSAYWLLRYSATIDNARAQITAGKSVDIEFDSATMDTTLRQTTVQGSASGFYDIFSGGIGGSFDQLSRTAAQSRMTIRGRIGKYATLATTPLGWVNSAEVSRAYNSKDDHGIWDPAATAGSWESFFSQPGGMLARRISQLLLISDYEITVTSHANYNSEDATKITAEANVGVWPFFSARGSASNQTRVTRNSDGSMSVTQTLPKGEIQVWGVTVQDVG